METKEIWKPIKGYEGYYEVSSNGRVRSINRVMPVANRWGKPTTMKNKSVLLSIHLGTNNYYGVVLCKNSKRKTFSVHRIVA